MVRRTYRQRSLIEVLLPDGPKLWDDELREIDAVLDDEEIVDRVDAALRGRRPKSSSRGRLGTPVVVVLRMLVLKHRYDWSFAECEREVRGSLIYRAFCRIDGERVPDAKTLIRLAALLGPDVLKDIVARLVHLARQRRVVRGHRLRVDTTVVETNIHYPTDSSLLADGVRVLTRTMQRICAEVGAAGRQVRDRTRSLGRRVFEITQRSRKATARTGAMVRARTKARMTALYRQAMAITRATVRQAETVSEAIADTVDLGMQALREQLGETVGLVRRVLAQTRARVLRGDTHYPDKVLSIFEPETEAIRKGKAAKPTEFGKLVKIQEAEAGFVTDYAVCPTRVSDQELWEPALTKHQELFDRPPKLAVADGGFASKANERIATELGVEQVALPRVRGRPAADAQPPPPRQRWFRRAMRWRTGCEGRISVLKRCHGLRRCRYRGTRGVERWVGLGVIAHNLRVLARAGPAPARKSGQR
jgi:transposase, IS5 family